MKYIKLFEDLTNDDNDLVIPIDGNQYEADVFQRDESVAPLSLLTLFGKSEEDKKEVSSHLKKTFKRAKISFPDKRDEKILKNYGFKSYSFLKKNDKPEHPSLKMRDNYWKGELIASSISKTGETYILDKTSPENSYVIINKLDDEYFYVKSVAIKRNGYHLEKYYKCDGYDGLVEYLSNIDKLKP